MKIHVTEFNIINDPIEFAIINRSIKPPNSYETVLTSLYIKLGANMKFTSPYDDAGTQTRRPCLFNLSLPSNNSRNTNDPIYSNNYPDYELIPMDTPFTMGGKIEVRASHSTFNVSKAAPVQMMSNVHPFLQSYYNTTPTYINASASTYTGGKMKNKQTQKKKASPKKKKAT